LSECKGGVAVAQVARGGEVAERGGLRADGVLAGGAGSSVCCCLQGSHKVLQQCRLQREAFGRLFSMDIFKGCGPIYVGKSTTPRPADLRELISICKGKVTTSQRGAAVAVGECLKGDEVNCVTEMWVLDSIHFNKLKSFKNYLLKTTAPHSPEF
jgi:hypothetical protein